MAELVSPIIVKMDKELKAAIMTLTQGITTLEERLRRIEQHIQDQEFERIERYADKLFGE